MRQASLFSFSFLLSLLYSTSSAASVIGVIAHRLATRKGGIIADRLDLDWWILLGGFVTLFITIVIAARWKASRDADTFFREI